MNAAETIQAAIDKLTKQRDASQSRLPGRWSNAEDREEITGSHGAIGEFWWPAHADLVVTLHATINPQISILEIAREAERGSWPGDPQPWTRRHVLPLARAILGEQVDA